MYFGKLHPQLRTLWLHYLAADLGRAVIFSWPLSLGGFVDLECSPTHRACCAFKYSLVKHLTGHMVTIGVGQTEGHMSTASVFQQCHISQSFLSVLSMFYAKESDG